MTETHGAADCEARKWNFDYDDDERRRAIEADSESKARIAEAQAEAAKVAARWSFQNDEARSDALKAKHAAEVEQAQAETAKAHAMATKERWRTIRHLIWAIVILVLFFGWRFLGK